MVNGWSDWYVEVGEVGDGGSCYAKIITDSYGGSTSSSKPRNGAGGDGGSAGDAVIGNSDNRSSNKNITRLF